MDASDIDNKPETTQEAESIAVDDLVIAKDQNTDPADDFADEDHENSEKLDVGLDPVAETEPSLDSTKPVESLSEELTQVTEDPVEIEQSLGEANGFSKAVIDSESKEIDSVPGQNGYSDPTPSQILGGVDPGLDETNRVSFKETTLPESVVTNVPKSIDVGESDVPEVPHSTENQPVQFQGHRSLMQTFGAQPKGVWRSIDPNHQFLDINSDNDSGKEHHDEVQLEDVCSVDCDDTGF
ncbi:hypothetical protein RHMOL_Rhmol06G0159900 [Rhododendron molle]|uniref:Uncharacterized protein n=1 Tax=Rhododendron molle TaxID=49168 RepID=A0ACC0NDE9_RHOML|nr:hypothetical protein RHMOL_Rhmol06G0159900 [Rhododendron molle]